jgi:hypothetical protein
MVEQVTVCHKAEMMHIEKIKQAPDRLTQPQMDDGCFLIDDLQGMPALPVTRSHQPC